MKYKNNRIDSMPDQFYGPIDKDLIKSKINSMVDTGVYSYYRGNGSEHFWGGPEIQRLEKQFEGYLKTDYGSCLAVNSCTSALIIACGAIGIEPGDEVIVSPWSMSCSATAPMIYGGIPVFADIGEDFCLDPEDIERKITDKTKAIIVVDLFGKIANYEEICKIASNHNLFVIEDAAQAIGATQDNKYAGTFGDIGCFSFTQGKHMSAGEGGMLWCSTKELYEKCAALRNHAESVNNDLYQLAIADLVGFNMRMTEIQAAILQEQLKWLDINVQSRIYKIKEIMKDMPNSVELWGGGIKKDHSYYVMPLRYKGEDIRKFVNIVKSNLKPELNRVDRGVPVGAGYIKPLYRFPIFSPELYPDLIIYAKKHWSIRDRDYTKVYCRNAENFNNKLIVCLLHSLNLNNQDIGDIKYAFKSANRIVNG